MSDLVFDAVIGVVALTAGRFVFSRHAPNGDRCRRRLQDHSCAEAGHLLLAVSRLLDLHSSDLQASIVAAAGEAGAPMPASVASATQGEGRQHLTRVVTAKA